MGHYVYKYVDKTGEIVYIGKNDTNLINRIAAHNSDEWNDGTLAISYIEVMSGWESDALETLLISKYRPRYNKSKMADTIVQFVEPEWVPIQRLSKTGMTSKRKEAEAEKLKKQIVEKYKQLTNTQKYIFLALLCMELDKWNKQKTKEANHE